MASNSRLSSAAGCTRGVCSKLRTVAVARWLLIIARKRWYAWQELEVRVATIGHLRDIVGGAYRFSIYHDYYDYYDYTGGKGVTDTARLQ